LKAAQEGICLLKNKNNLLPLHNSIRSISVIGTLAKSEYTGDYSPIGAKGTSILDGLKRRLSDRIKIEYAEGYSKDTLTNLKSGKSFIEKATQASILSDISIVVLGEDESTDGENRDRASLNLPKQQEDLIHALYKTGKPIVVVLLNGRPLKIDWIARHIPAIVEGWYIGDSSGMAIADVLLGNVNPAGKLPITFPRSVGQLPYYYDHKPSSWHLYVDEKNTPLFPFGFGLSYTTFQYSTLEVYPEKVSDTGIVHVSLNVRNAGEVRGTEVVQLYVRDEESSVTTPVKALKGFKRVTLNPKESKRISFSINPDQLAIWNRNMKHVVEPGKFTVMIGSSSEDIREEGGFIVSE
jgi:beta-glucosidase